MKWAWGILAAASALAWGEAPSWSMAQAMRSARMNAPVILSARADLALEQAKYRESLAALWPSLGAGARFRDYTFNPAAQGLEIPGLPLPDRLGPVEAWESGITARFELFDLPAWRRIGAARTLSQAESLQVAAAEDQCAFAAAAAYLACQLAHKRSENRAQGLAMADSLLTLTRGRKASGAATGIDVTRAELQVLLQRDALLAARTEEQESLARLHSAMGVPFSAEAVLADTLGAPPLGFASASDDLRSAALDRRAELRASGKRVLAADQEAGAASAGHLPVVKLQAEYGYSGTDLHSLETVRAVSLGLEWSLWDGGRTSARHAQDLARKRRAEAKEAEARTGIEDEVRSASLRFRDAGERVLTAREQILLSRREWDEMKTRFREGMSASAELIEAQDRLIKARDGWYLSLHSYNSSRLALYRAVGMLDTF